MLLRSAFRSQKLTWQIKQKSLSFSPGWVHPYPLFSMRKRHEHTWSAAVPARLPYLDVASYMLPDPQLVDRPWLLRLVALLESYIGSKPALAAVRFVYAPVVIALLSFLIAIKMVKNVLQGSLAFAGLVALSTSSPLSIRDITTANAEAAYNALMGWYNQQNGLWIPSTGWWNSANCSWCQLTQCMLL